MKKILFTILLFISSLSIADNKAYKANKKAKLPTELTDIWSKNNKVLPYLDEKGYIVLTPEISQPLIVCKLGHVCILELTDNEVLLGENPIILGLNQWNIDHNVFERHGVVKTTLLLRPNNNEGETTMAILTNYRTHNIKLISTKNRFMSKTRFANDPKIVIKQRPVINSVKQTKPKRNITINQSYSITGDKEIKWRPVHVYDDGNQTFITLSNKSKNYSSVRVSSISNEEEKIVNFKFETSSYTLIVDGVYEQLYLTTNDDKIFVTNKELYK